MTNQTQRKQIRLNGFDYSSNGAYFVTICVRERRELLGKIDVGSDALGAPSVELSKYGEFVSKEIEKTPSHYDGVLIAKYIVMPNHLHMIIVVNRNIGEPNYLNGVPRASRPTMLIPNIISVLKKKTNKMIGYNIWQTSYHDHIIRNEEDYLAHLKYIDENPIKWAEDEYYNLTKTY